MYKLLFTNEGAIKWAKLRFQTSSVSASRSSRWHENPCTFYYYYYLLICLVPEGKAFPLPPRPGLITRCHREPPLGSTGISLTFWGAERAPRPLQHASSVGTRSLPISVHFLTLHMAHVAFKRRFVVQPARCIRCGRDAEAFFKSLHFCSLCPGCLSLIPRYLSYQRRRVHAVREGLTHGNHRDGVKAASERAEKPSGLLS